LSETRQGKYSKNNMETISRIRGKAERNGISGPVFTLGTANSACSAAFYARISGIRANPLKYMDPDGIASVDSKQFIAHTMGNGITALISNSRIISTSGKRGSSMPWGTIRIPANDRYQGGYNPDYWAGGSATEAGRIGIETHELWHQVQYKSSVIKTFFRLITEQIKYILGIDNPYSKGDPRNSSVLNSISKLDDISTLEGQAQFVGQWNADVYAYMNGENIDMNRLRQEARIILRSGYESQAAKDILCDEL
jgi:hypothetical protein